MKSTSQTFAAAAVALLLYPGPCFASRADRNGAGGKSAQASSTAAGHWSRFEINAPRVELFLGYSYLRAVPVLAPQNRMEWLHGGSASVAFNLNRYLGLVGDFGGFKATELEITGAGATPAGVSSASGTALTFLAGPRLSLRKYDRLTPFAQVLVGGIHASEVTLANCTGRLCTPLPLENALALTAGGGVDITLQRHFAIRLIQAEYMMTRFANLSTGYRQTQNDMRLSSGLVLRFGELNPPLPVAYSCVASPSSVYPGDPVTVTGSALNLNPKMTPAYTWSADGGTINGATATASIDTRNAAPGPYMARGHVSEGNKPGQSADCTAGYSVMDFQSPTVSCSADPATIQAGDSSAISAQAISPQGRPLTYSYAASQGSIGGNGSSATLGTAGVSPGTIAVTCSVVDDKKQRASATASVLVQAQPQPAVVTTQALCTVRFDRDARRPARVDNEAKACLDDIALALQRSADAKAAMVGNADSSADNAPSSLAAQRAVNARDYLVTEKGVDASRISVYTGNRGSNGVETILVPPGAELDPAGLTPVAGSVRPVPRNGQRTAEGPRSRQVKRTQ